MNHDDPGFHLPVLTPAIGAEAIVVIAIILIASGQATYIAAWLANFGAL